VSIQLFNGDCLTVMATLPEQSVDAVICDPPYGTTECAWDSVIPLPAMWENYERLVKPRGAIVLTCTQPFASSLVMSKLDWFRHEWVWDKVAPTGFQNTKHKPMMRHESIMVFSREAPDYRPVMQRLDVPVVRHARQKPLGSLSSPLMGGDDCKARKYYGSFPQSILLYTRPKPNVHPTQKPVELMAYLIETYTRKGGVVLDNTMGSGSTGVACVNTGRGFIGVEMDPHWFEVASKRIREAECRPEQPGLGLDPLDVDAAVQILEEEDPPMAAAMKAGDEDEAIDEVFGA